MYCFVVTFLSHRSLIPLRLLSLQKLKDTFAGARFGKLYFTCTFFINYTPMYVSTILPSPFKRSNLELLFHYGYYLTTFTFRSQGMKVDLFIVFFGKSP